MPRIRRLDPSDAPPKSRAVLDSIAARRGSVGEMVATMAHSPALLTGYLDLSQAMKRVKLPRTLSEKISIALQVWIGCSRCLAAHTQAARTAGLSDTDITLARQGVSSDNRESALIAVALRILAEPYSITDADVTELREHGWADRIIIELVGLVTLNLLTGAFNLLVGLTADDQDRQSDTDHVATADERET